MKTSLTAPAKLYACRRAGFGTVLHESISVKAGPKRVVVAYQTGAGSATEHVETDYLPSSDWRPTVEEARAALRERLAADAADLDARASRARAVITAMDRHDQLLAYAMRRISVGKFPMVKPLADELALAVMRDLNAAGGIGCDAILYSEALKAAVEVCEGLHSLGSQVDLATARHTFLVRVALGRLAECVGPGQDKQPPEALELVELFAAPRFATQMPGNELPTNAEGLRAARLALDYYRAGILSLEPRPRRAVKVEPLTRSEWDTLCWLSKRGYDGSILDRVKVVFRDDNHAELSELSPDDVEAVWQYVQDDPACWLACNGSASLAAKLAPVLAAAVDAPCCPDCGAGRLPASTQPKGHVGYPVWFVDTCDCNDDHGGLGSDHE